MDKLLISGSGKGNSAVYFWCFIELLIAAAGGVIMYYASTKMNVTTNTFFTVVTTKHPMAGYVYYCGLLVLIWGLICAVAISYCIKKTQIYVYENRIEGIGVGRYFLWGDLRTRHFRLAYDQITSFDTTSSSITIGATNAVYSCYASNANEIQGVIFNQKQAK